MMTELNIERRKKQAYVAIRIGLGNQSQVEHLQEKRCRVVERMYRVLLLRSRP